MCVVLFSLFPHTKWREASSQACHRPAAALIVASSEWRVIHIHGGNEPRLWAAPHCSTPPTLCLGQKVKTFFFFPKRDQSQNSWKSLFYKISEHNLHCSCRLRRSESPSVREKGRVSLKPGTRSGKHTFLSAPWWITKKVLLLVTPGNQNLTCDLRGLTDIHSESGLSLFSLLQVSDLCQYV